MGFIIRGFIWDIRDIPILIFAYVLFSGPTLEYSSTLSISVESSDHFVGFFTKSCRIHVGDPENRGPQYSTLNSRILIIRSPK